MGGGVGVFCEIIQAYDWLGFSERRRERELRSKTGERLLGLGLGLGQNPT